jgi:hypothetical protein
MAEARAGQALAVEVDAALQRLDHLDLHAVEIGQGQPYVEPPRPAAIGRRHVAGHDQELRDAVDLLEEIQRLVEVVGHIGGLVEAAERWGHGRHPRVSFPVYGRTLMAQGAAIQRARASAPPDLQEIVWSERAAKARAGSALLRLEARVGLVDHIDHALAPDDLAVPVAQLERLDRASDLHDLNSTRRGPGRAPSNKRAAIYE